VNACESTRVTDRADVGVAHDEPDPGVRAVGATGDAVRDRARHDHRLQLGNQVDLRRTREFTKPRPHHRACGQVVGTRARVRERHADELIDTVDQRAGSRQRPGQLEHARRLLREVAVHIIEDVAVPVGERATRAPAQDEFAAVGPIAQCDGLADPQRGLARAHADLRRCIGLAVELGRDLGLTDAAITSVSARRNEDRCNREEVTHRGT
jgi:hypothetical protein